MLTTHFRARLAAVIITVAAFASLLPAKAAFSQRDVLIKGSGTGAAVYYLAYDGKRYVFPNQKTYNTWFTNFNSVITVSDADLMSFPLGGNVTYRPGIRLVKITTDPRTYAVDTNGTLRWVTSESLARTLYGNDWNTKVDDVPDAFFTNYRLGTQITAASQYDPHTAAGASPTINADRGMTATSGAIRANTTPDAPRQSTSCNADVWVCGEWSACGSNGRQTRNCSLSTDCPSVTSARPEESQTCTYVPPAGGGTVSVQEDTEAGNVIAEGEAVLAKFRLNAQHEDLDLVRASFSVEDAIAVSQLRLYDGNTAVTAWQDVNGSGDVHFSGIEDFTVARNTGKDLSVRGRLNPVGPTSAPSGSNARVTMRTTSGTYRFEMRSSSPTGPTQITSIPGGDKVGNDKILRKTVITAANVNLPSGALVAGDVVAGRVRFSADDAGDASIKALTVRVLKPTGITVAVTGGASLSTVREQGSGTNIAGHSTAEGCNSSSTSCTIRVLFADELVIAAGDDKTLDIRLNVSGTIGSGSMQTYLESDSNDVDTGELTDGSDDDQVRVDGDNVNFAWSDNSVIPHSAEVDDSSQDWASGAYIEGLPNDSQILRD